MFEIFKILDIVAEKSTQATTFLIIFVNFYRNFISFYI